MAKQQEPTPKGGKGKKGTKPSGPSKPALKQDERIRVPGGGRKNPKDLRVPPVR